MDIPKSQRLLELRMTFTPSAPVTRQDAFAGRQPQILKAAGGIASPGRHVVLYGERGVGKTSLSNVLASVLGSMSAGFALASVRVNCNVNTTFASLWSEIGRELHLDVPDSWRYETPSPEAVRHLLEAVIPPTIIVIDEYDRHEDDTALSLMADTIKTLSDHLVATKLVLVGVADDVDALVGEHESVRRALDQVMVPRMTPDEIQEVVEKGLGRVGISASDDAMRRIVRLAEGLPSYAHALPLEAGTHAVADDRGTIVADDINVAIREIVNNHTSRSSYLKATQSQRKDNNFASVLAACALADKDELGYFAPFAVREPLSAILQRRVDIPSYARHLASFLSPERGSVLDRTGEIRRYRYRFRDPMLQPFAVMAAIDAGLIPQDYQDGLFRA